MESRSRGDACRTGISPALFYSSIPRKTSYKMKPRRQLLPGASAEVADVHPGKCPFCKTDVHLGCISEGAHCTSARLDSVRRGRRRAPSAAQASARPHGVRPRLRHGDSCDDVLEGAPDRRHGGRELLPLPDEALGPALDAVDPAGHCAERLEEQAGALASRSRLPLIRLCSLASARSPRAAGYAL
jgi:hypothetical protein